jgi:hypothetical protein
MAGSTAPLSTSFEGGLENGVPLFRSNSSVKRFCATTGNCPDEKVEFTKTVPVENIKCKDRIQRHFIISLLTRQIGSGVK